MSTTVCYVENAQATQYKQANMDCLFLGEVKIVKVLYTVSVCFNGCLVITTSGKFINEFI